MKAISLSLATALVLATVALAQSPPPNTTEDASSAAKTAPESMPANGSSPGSQSPSAADASQASTQATSPSCHKQAADKKLTGDDKTNFIKSCKQGKVSRTGS
jgi:hypothetical protein